MKSNLRNLYLMLMLGILLGIVGFNFPMAEIFMAVFAAGEAVRMFLLFLKGRRFRDLFGSLFCVAMSVWVALLGRNMYPTVRNAALVCAVLCLTAMMIFFDRTLGKSKSSALTKES